MFNLRFFAGSLFNLAILATLYKIIPFFFFPPLLLITVVMLLYPLGAVLYRKYKSSRIHESTLGIGLWFAFTAFLLIEKALEMLPPLYQADNVVIRFLTIWLILIITLTPILVLAGAFEYALLENMAIRKKGYAFVVPYTLFLFATLIAFISSIYMPAYLGLSSLFVFVLLLLPFYLGFSERFRLLMIILAVILSVLVPSLVNEETLVDVTGKYHRQATADSEGPKEPVLSESGLENSNDVSIFNNWGRLGYFSMVGQSNRSQISGFYYGRNLWRVKPESFSYQPLDRAIFRMLGDLNGKVAIIGSGGGRQVDFAYSAGLRRIHAVDLEESLPAAMKQAEKMGYPNPYARAGVQLFNMDGRRFLENAPDNSYSMILIADAGNYPSMISTMLSSHGLLHTQQAYNTYKQKLSKNGLFVFWCWKAFPSYKHMMQQFMETMRSAGLNAAAFENNEEFIVVGSRDLFQQQIEKHVLSFSRMFDVRKAQDISAIKVRVATDQNLHSGLSYLVGYELSRIIIVAVSAFLLVICVCTLASFSLKAAPGDRKKTAWRSALALLIGLNYILLQVAAIYSITRSTYDIYLGATGGVIAFLSCYLIGTIVYYSLGQKNVFSIFIFLAVIAFSLLAWGYTLAFILILSSASSIFFPVLFEFCESMRTQIFVMDAIGSVSGAFIGFGITYMFGTGALSLAIAGLVLIIISIAVPVLNGMRKGNAPCV